MTMFRAINMIKGLCVALLFSTISLANADSSNEDVFTEIYKEKKFGSNSKGEAHSGGGSTLENTKVYREFLQAFLRAYRIHSVVDVGCGDWEFSQAINWKGIQYYGYDVVEFLIEQNKSRYQKKNIHFFKSDGIHDDLPPADLLICKDVLQHLPNEDILLFLQQLPKYKFCLITNDVDPATLSSTNPDIERGSFRPLDLTKPPFSINGIKSLVYKSDGIPKQVLLIKNNH